MGGHTRPTSPMVMLVFGYHSSRLSTLLILVLLASLPGCGPGLNEESGTVATPSRVPLAPVERSASAEAASAQPTVSSVPVPTPPPQVTVPEWMKVALQHPDARVRLLALDYWEEQESAKSVDPLMLALSDADERVRTRALQLIEQQWAAEQAASERHQVKGEQ